VRTDGKAAAKKLPPSPTWIHIEAVKGSIDTVRFPMRLSGVPYTVRFPIETVRVSIETVRFPIETVRGSMVPIETGRGSIDCEGSHRDCQRFP
jgi:hypothetical protein